MRIARMRRVGLAVALGLSALAGVAPTNAAPWIQTDQFANDSFRQIWTDADRPVAQGSAARSWMWGPTPWWDYKEAYRNSPNGLRQVQYFDKARMEINNPANSTPRGVTNGLLTVELVSGRMKVGDGIGFEDNIDRGPAQVPVAGNPAQDNPTAPTYASFTGVATIDNGYRDPNRIGQRVTAVLDKAGNRTENAAFAHYTATTIVAYNTVTGHNVPRVFRDFINNGPVDGLFAFGQPISDPYWVQAKVGSEQKDVLVQLFERRVLTYTPTNTPSFRVEMGNVGQHYFQWRYPDLGLPWRYNLGIQQSVSPIAFASKRAIPDHWETFLTNIDGIVLSQLTSGTQETVPYSWRRTYMEFEPSGQINIPRSPRLMTDSKRVNGLRELFSINPYDSSDVRQHTPASNGIAFNGAVSPDGNLIAAAVQASGDNSALTIIPFDQDRATVWTLTPIRRDCRYESPTWLPDGSGLVFAANCNGKMVIYRGDINVFDPINPYGVEVVNARPIVATPNADNYFPRVSPDGSKVVFASNRNGNGDIYVINIDGTGERRLTDDPADDGAASWSWDGTQLVFDSNRDGDYEIYKMSLANPSQITKLTDNTVDDRWPLWAQ